MAAILHQDGRQALRYWSEPPAHPAGNNLYTTLCLRDVFRCKVGLSDHTLGIGAAVASVALGAQVIEKHITLSRADGGVDADFSLEPHELKLLVDETRRAWQALGEVKVGPTQAEENSRVFRRSLYFTKDLKAGDVVTKDAVRSIRPGYGLPPSDLDKVLGHQVVREVQSGEPVTWGNFLLKNMMRGSE